MPIEPGFHPDIPNEEYHRRELGVVSKSALDQLHETPATYHHWVTSGAWERTPALAIGSALHAAVLEPERFASDWAIAPEFGDCRCKEPKAKRDFWRAQNVGKEWLDADDGAMVQGMAASVRAHPIVAALLGDCLCELTVAWVDPKTGLHCKVRPDGWHPGKRIILDLKTTEDASAKAFAKSVANYRYHVQDALYTAGVEANGVEVDRFIFVAVEKRAPYLVGCHYLDATSRDLGRIEMREDMDRMARCVRDGEWPGYPVLSEISLPKWAMRE